MDKTAILSRAKRDPDFRRRMIAQLRVKAQTKTANLLSKEILNCLVPRKDLVKEPVQVP